MTFGLDVPGFATQYWFSPGVGFTFDIDDPDAYHRMVLQCEYVGESNGNPVYRFKLQIDAAMIFVSPARELAYWSDTMHHIGFFGRRETTPVTSSGVQSLVSCDWIRSVDEIRREHNPAPAMKSVVARTPIVPEDETGPGAIPVFPFEIRLNEIKYVDPHRTFTSQAGYETESPVQPGARRVYDCYWQGTRADRDTFEDFYDDNLGNFFRITIRAQGIGTVNVQMVSPNSDFEAITRDVHRTTFELIEVADAS
jgi:hypothetical protein